MKNILKQASLVSLVILCIITSPTLSAQSNQDKEAIKATALNYIEGWYSADTARMAKALAPDLKKRGFVFNDKTKKLEIWDATYPKMIIWTGKRKNMLKEDPDMKLEVKIIEISENIAMVKTVTPDFIDYLHMGKMNGEWRIYNAIWEFNKK